MTSKRGDQLAAGDTISVWWRPGRDTIIDLKPYTGSLAYLWEGQAQIATFAINRIGMTIEPQIEYEVID